MTTACPGPAIDHIHAIKMSKNGPFFCPTCGKEFASNIAVHRHSLIHTGQRPYPCQHCRASFRCSSHLKRHERLHTGERPYSCEDCGRRYADSTSLLRHCEAVHQKSPYPCGHCDQGFGLERDLRQHLEESHQLFLLPANGRARTLCENIRKSRQMDAEAVVEGSQACGPELVRPPAATQRGSDSASASGATGRVRSSGRSSGHAAAAAAAAMAIRQNIKGTERGAVRNQSGRPAKRVRTEEDDDEDEEMGSDEEKEESEEEEEMAEESKAELVDEDEDDGEDEDEDEALVLVEDEAQGQTGRACQQAGAQESKASVGSFLDDSQGPEAALARASTADPSVGSSKMGGGERGGAAFRLESDRKRGPSAAKSPLTLESNAGSTRESLQDAKPLHSGGGWDPAVKAGSGGGGGGGIGGSGTGSGSYSFLPPACGGGVNGGGGDAHAPFTMRPMHATPLALPAAGPQASIRAQLQPPHSSSHPLPGAVLSSSSGIVVGAQVSQLVPSVHHAAPPGLHVQASILQRQHAAESGDQQGNDEREKKLQQYQQLQQLQHHHQPQQHQHQQPPPLQQHQQQQHQHQHQHLQQQQHQHVLLGVPHQHELRQFQQPLSFVQLPQGPPQLLPVHAAVPQGAAFAPWNTMYYPWPSAGMGLAQMYGGAPMLAGSPAPWLGTMDSSLPPSAMGRYVLLPGPHPGPQAAVGQPAALPDARLPAEALAYGYGRHVLEPAGSAVAVSLALAQPQQLHLQQERLPQQYQQHYQQQHYQQQQYQHHPYRTELEAHRLSFSSPHLTPFVGYSPPVGPMVVSRDHHSMPVAGATPFPAHGTMVAGPPALSLSARPGGADYAPTAVAGVAATGNLLHARAALVPPAASSIAAPFMVLHHARHTLPVAGAPPAGTLEKPGATDSAGR